MCHTHVQHCKRHCTEGGEVLLCPLSWWQKDVIILFGEICLIKCKYKCLFLIFFEKSSLKRGLIWHRTHVQWFLVVFFDHLRWTCAKERTGCYIYAELIICPKTCPFSQYHTLCMFNVLYYYFFFFLNQKDLIFGECPFYNQSWHSCMPDHYAEFKFSTVVILHLP